MCLCADVLINPFGVANLFHAGVQCQVGYCNIVRSPAIAVAVSFANLESFSRFCDSTFHSPPINLLLFERTVSIEDPSTAVIYREQ